ncbi:SCO3374 family protein [Streptomyces sp. NPDC005805]|uniref:SCO3374 family protein n=1 Tax=Streptomyces sp. NPDC005805 TaxID=3157068 RepID=UPI0033DAAD7B
MALTVPHPRSSPERDAAHWYRTALGWETAEGPPLQLPTGEAFDVLELPADAGAALLARGPATGPVALEGAVVRLLVAAGSAEELPGLLQWLDWDGVALDLTAIGAGGRITAPPQPGSIRPTAARWLRPPGREARLPALAGPGGGGAAPDLVRLVATAAGECHRFRLLRARRAPAGKPGNQPLAFSYASRMSAGTRPRSFTL